MWRVDPGRHLVGGVRAVLRGGVLGRLDDVVVRGDPAGAFGALWFRTGTDVLTAALAVDNPRDVSAARRLFGGADLPRLDRAVAADAGRKLRDAQL